jgi:hypothetical protein
MHNYNRKFKMGRKEGMHLALVLPPSDRSSPEAMAHKHRVHPKLNPFYPFLFSLSSSFFRPTIMEAPWMRTGLALFFASIISPRGLQMLIQDRMNDQLMKLRIGARIIDLNNHPA